jgi:hypothetical protein
VGEGNFFGEGSLAGQLLRMGSAVAMTDCEILRVEKKAMMDVLQREPAFSERFVAYLLGRNIRYERIWSTNCSTPAKKDWPACFSCSLILASTAFLKRWSPRSARRRWLKWSGRLVRESASS